MTVVGIGNDFRGDDAAGLVAAQRLRELRPTQAVVEWTGDVIELFESLPPCDGVVLMDAVSSGAAPGSVVRWDAVRDRLEDRSARTSTHAISVGAAIELSRALGRLPARVLLFGIEGVSFQEGAPLSPTVAVGIDEMVKRVLAEVDSHA